MLIWFKSYSEVFASVKCLYFIWNTDQHQPKMEHKRTFDFDSGEESSGLNAASCFSFHISFDMWIGLLVFFLSVLCSSLIRKAVTSGKWQVFQSRSRRSAGTFEPQTTSEDEEM